MKIPADKNVSVAEFEKLSKHKDIEIKVEKLWHMKTVTIPVVIWVLGIIKKGTEKHLEKIRGSPNVAEIQKIALTGTACIQRKTFSMWKNQTMNNWRYVECICTEQKRINYTPYLYLHFIFTLFILFIFYSIYCYL